MQLGLVKRDEVDERLWPPRDNELPAIELFMLMVVGPAEEALFCSATPTSPLPSPFVVKYTWSTTTCRNSPQLPSCLPFVPTEFLFMSVEILVDPGYLIAGSDSLQETGVSVISFSVSTSVQS